MAHLNYRAYFSLHLYFSVLRLLNLQSNVNSALTQIQCQFTIDPDPMSTHQWSKSNVNSPLTQIQCQLTIDPDPNVNSPLTQIQCQLTTDPDPMSTHHGPRSNVNSPLTKVQCQLTIDPDPNVDSSMAQIQYQLTTDPDPNVNSPLNHKKIHCVNCQSWKNSGSFCCKCPRPNIKLVAFWSKKMSIVVHPHPHWEFELTGLKKHLEVKDMRWCWLA
jgi:hypothetical protein